MIIKDSQNLLPLAIPDEAELPEMVLEIPPHGIPLHPKSIDRLLKNTSLGKRILLFQPKLPVTSELGLPPYPILAYLYPQTLSQALEPFFQELATRTPNLNNFPSIFRVIDQIDKEEVLYYFADYYGKAVKPTFVRAIVGNSCNLKCVMCPYHSPAIKPTHKTNFFQENRAMSWEMMERFARDCGTLRTSVLIGSVEEPLLHPRIVDFVRLCRQEGVPHVHITTNGQLLNEERSRALLEAGLTSLDVSLDATNAQTYRRIRGSDFHRVEANIQHFLELRERLKIPCHVRTSFVRNPDVPPEAEEQFQQQWLTKLDSVYILNLAKYKEKNIRIERTNGQVRKLVQSYLQQSEGRWTCAFPFTEVLILPDGRVYYCIETAFRLGFDGETESMGNYHQQTLLQIWQGETFKNFRRDLILHRLDSRIACLNCEMWRSQVIAHTHQNGFHVMTTEATEIYYKTPDKSGVKSEELSDLLDGKNTQ